MAVEQVQYELTLKDLLTNKLHEADGAAKKLHGTMDLVKESLGFLGVGFAVFKGGEFIKQSVEKFHELEQANAQIKAGLESTKGAAGLTFDDIQKGAKDLSSGMLYGRTAMLQMQSVLLTFPAVTKESFMPASQLIADMSTRLGTDLKGSAIQVGKALQDPIKGVSALHRVGVNFSEAQKEMIKNMVATGHTAQAQQVILKELSVEFGGSAKAAFEADPIAGFNKMMGSFSMAVGQAGEELLGFLAPALFKIGSLFVSAGEGIKHFIEWLKENQTIVKAVGIGLGVAAVAYGLYTLYVNAATIGTTILTAATWALDAALAVLTSPITLVIAAIAAVTASVMWAYDTFGKFRGGVWATWAVLKEFASIVGDVFMGLGKTITGILTFDPKMIASGAEQAISAVKNAAERIGKAGKEGYAAGMADFGKPKEEEKKKVAKGPMGAIQPERPTKDISPKGATGQKSVTINISINKLIEQFKVSTTNMQESYGKIQEHVANTLLQAVNDSSIQAGI